jgi:hypothetical protein
MEADLDHDGKISFEEFTKMVENTDVSMSMTLGMLHFCFSWNFMLPQTTTADYSFCRPILDSVLTAIPAGRNLPGVLSETLVGCWGNRVHRQQFTRKRTRTQHLHSDSVHPSSFVFILARNMTEIYYFLTSNILCIVTQLHEAEG